MDLFVVPTIGFDLLYGFVIVRLGSVGIQDSHPGSVVIQAMDGPIRFD
ncbi:hypothetical protein J6497_39775 [Bradyrhizobium sp. CNPSo 4026]|nr:hypothetical protein [Bradyrhizobium cenepequi]